MEHEEALEKETPVEETPTAVEETQEETQPEEPQEVEDSGRGDLSVALRQERAKRQQMEKALSDPNFVYQKAVELGLAEAEANVPRTPQTPDVSKTVEEILDYREAVKEFPDVEKKPELRAWAGALVDQGYTHKEAVGFIKQTLEGAKQQAKAEGMKAKEQEISDKENAQTITQTTNVTSEQFEDEQLRTKAKSLNRVEQEDALVKMLMKKL